jgi:hypothetical protein
MNKILKKKREKNPRQNKKDSHPLSDYAQYYGDDSIFLPQKNDSSFSFLGEVHHSKISNEISDQASFYSKFKNMNLVSDGHEDLEQINNNF